MGAAGDGAGPRECKELAALIGDKTGPAIIASTYGDLRPDHLLAQAQRIRLTVADSTGGADGGRGE